MSSNHSILKRSGYLSMKSKIKYLALTLLLSSTVLGACTPAPANNTPAPPTAPAAPATPAVDASADLQVAVTRINEKAFNDKAFSQELQANPKAVLAAEGLSLAADDRIKVLNFLNEEGKVYLILDDRNLERFYGEQIKNPPSDADADESLKTFRAIRAKAETDNDFKASLLADPATVLAAEGFHTEAAKNFEVIDFEADTHFFLILPPDQQVTRGAGAEAFAVIIDPKIYFLATIMNGDRKPEESPEDHVSNNNMFRLLDGRGPIIADKSPFFYNRHLTTLQKYLGELDGIIQFQLESAFVIIEGICVVPRWFGAACGASRTQIKEKFKNHFFARHMEDCTPNKSKEACEQDTIIPASEYK